ncbi:MAG: HPr(Ser) kinase/phosphatase, partial [Lachnospiraceae bacterium]|nr:HPr(Ser) kinase/phosphatase [Lachnospiraceae bacterium]
MTVGADLATLTKKLSLKNFTESIDLKNEYVYIPDVNRPALQLNGFYEHFEANRVQIIGMVEHAYLEQIDEEERNKRYDKLLSYPIPAIIFCRGFEPEEYFLETAIKNSIPVLGTDR